VSIAAFRYAGCVFHTGAIQRASAVAFLTQVSGSAAEPTAPPARFPAPVPLIGAGILAMALVQGGTLWFPGAFDGWTLGAAVFLALLGITLVLAGRAPAAPGAAA
jgi:hypothetical protein